MDASRDLVNSCSYNLQEIISKFAGFGEAVGDHLLFGDISEFGNGFVISNGLLDADDVSQESLVFTGLEVVDTTEEILVVCQS